jgi:hypothetical protein
MIRFFFLAMLCFVMTSSGAGTLVSGGTYALKLVDVDGRTLSTADGHVTVLVLAARRDLDKTRLVGNRIPDRCLGNPKYRMITVLRFDPTQNRTMRFVSAALVRRGLNTEAKRLKPRYVEKKLTRNPRGDLYAVAEFDNSTASQLGLQDNSAPFRVLVLSEQGVLIRDWTDVPSEQELRAAIP